jgi:hypothetical protein
MEHRGVAAGEQAETAEKENGRAAFMCAGGWAV